MGKLTAVSYGLLIVGVVVMVFDLNNYLLSLQPRNCYFCAPLEYHAPTILSNLAILFTGSGAVVKLADHENKKATRKIIHGD
jgi:hypothetical protein